MRRTVLYQLLSLVPILFHEVSALPGGCGGTLEIIDIQSDQYNGTVWACAGIDRSSIFGGLAMLINADDQSNVTTCADYCSTTSFPDGLMAGIWDSDNSTCECWYIGDLNYYDLPAADPGVTFIDFFEAWNPGGRPSLAQNWGVFTCPAGASSGGTGDGAMWCGPVSIETAQPALAELGIIGDCAGFCSEYPGFQWVLSTRPSDCNCYGDLAGLNVTLNYSSSDYILDYYDFEPHTSTSTSTSSEAKTTSRSSTSSAVKSSSKSSSHTTTKSVSKSSSGSTHTTTTTSKTSSKTTLKTTSSKSTSHSVSTSTSKTSSKTSLKTSSVTSSKTSSKSSSKTTSSSSKTTPHSTSTSISKTTSKISSSTKSSTHVTSGSSSSSTWKSTQSKTTSSSSK